MKFLALLAALLIEQVRPLRAENPLYRGYAQFARMLEEHLNGGDYRQGVAAWLLAVLPLAAVVFAFGWLLHLASPVLWWLWSAVVLYATVGFRQFSHFFGEIGLMIRGGNLPAACDLLGRWRREPASGLASEEVARVAIELGLLASHRAVFGPIVWFLLLGPAGAVLYRTADLLQEQWQSRNPDPALKGREKFGEFARSAFGWIDWVPARLTAASFAVVGNFQDAVECWRTQARDWANRTHGVILASGAGALGVKLGGDLHEFGHVHYRPELGAGDTADADYMTSTVGLIWRALVMWMFLIFIVTLSYSLG